MPPLLDAHCHLHDAWFTPHRARILADLRAAGISRLVVNGTNESDWPDVTALCTSSELSALSTKLSAPSPPNSQPFALSSQPTLTPSYGLHPWDAGNRTPTWLTILRATLDANPHAALGEIGLDRWILDSARPDDTRLTGLRRAPLEEQIEVFVAQLTLAAERNLPTSIHCLEAFGPLYDTLRATPLPARGFLLHAYNGSTQLAKSFADLGAHFSFNGAFLDPRKERLRSLYAQLPADRLLVETDAPAMRLPAPLEKFPPLTTPDGAVANHPANLATTYTALATLRAVPLDTLATQVAENFTRLFGPAS